MQALAGVLLAGLCAMAPALAAGPAIAAGDLHTCALSTSGTVQCWGSGGFGQLGNGSTDRSALPVAVKGVSTAVAVASGYSHSCAVLQSGAVQCWGGNANGQLGNGATANSAVPVTVSGISTAIAIAAGYRHSCAVLSSGGVSCWGDNSSGQLAQTATQLDNGTQNSRTPLSVNGLSGKATEVTAGEFHSCALISGGSLQCWGGNRFGQLGIGTDADSRTPVTVSGISTAIGVSASQLHSCAVLSAGTVSCWGSNTAGQLGNGSSSPSTSPVSVTGISNAKRVSAGYRHSCAQTGSGAVQCWGDNGFGELGTDNKTVRSSNVPVAVTGIATAVALSAGTYHSCAVLSSGAAQCWGAGDTGSLGNGSTALGANPVPVNVLTSDGKSPLNLGATVSNTNADADKVFNWAEKTYSQFFSPAGAQSQTLGDFYFRFYSGSNSYLAVSNSRLYYLGPLTGNTISDFGELSFWVSQVK